MTELYRQLHARLSGGVFLLRACPDGEGMWSADSSPEIVAQIRKKGPFSKNFIEFVEEAITGLRQGFAITLLDLGGKRIFPNDKILTASTHCIILSSSAEEKKQWIKFAEKYDSKIIAVLDSKLVFVNSSSKEIDMNARSQINILNSPITGEIVNLDRETGVEPYQEAISQLANCLVKMAT